MSQLSSPASARDLDRLREAFAVARAARDAGRHPFGAIVVDEAGQVIARAGNNSMPPEGDPTQHAELRAAATAARERTPAQLARATLYTSAEPCCMCAGAIYWTGIGRVVYGLSEHALLGLTGAHPENPTLALPCREVFARGQRAIEVLGPLLEDEAAAAHHGFWQGQAVAAVLNLYLSGPDVFRPDAPAHGQALVALCAEYGFRGLYPLDEHLPAHLSSPLEQARWIYRANVALIERCDAVLANLDFFRGAEPDSGTCFEVGYAVARGKPVWGYVPEGGSLAERIRLRHPHVVAGDLLDVDGWRLEEFGLPLNLMLGVPCRIVVGDARAALRAMRAAQPQQA